jgi:hypothetical protein
MIFLTLFPQDAQEIHVKWEGHSSIDSAKKELAAVREAMIRDNRVPMDCEVYEAENPPFGLPVYLIDDVDFNFYREKTPEEIEASKKRFDEVMKLVETTKDKVERAEELAMSIQKAVEKAKNANV